MDFTKNKQKNKYNRIYLLLAALICSTLSYSQTDLKTTSLGTNEANRSGRANVFIGLASGLVAELSSFSNTAIGTQTGYELTTGSNNYLGGYQVGLRITTGSQNTAVGSRSSHNLIEGKRNTTLGANSGFNMTGNENTIIGTGAGRNIGRVLEMFLLESHRGSMNRAQINFI